MTPGLTGGMQSEQSERRDRREAFTHLVVGALWVRRSGFRCQRLEIRPFNSSRDRWENHFAKAYDPRGREAEEEGKKEGVTIHPLLFLVGVCDCCWRKVKLPSEWCGRGLVIR